MPSGQIVAAHFKTISTLTYDHTSKDFTLDAPTQLQTTSRIWYANDGVIGTDTGELVWINTLRCIQISNNSRITGIYCTETGVVVVQYDG